MPTAEYAFRSLAENPSKKSHTAAASLRDYKLFMEAKDKNEYTKEVFEDEFVQEVFDWYHDATDFCVTFSTNEADRRIQARRGEKCVREFYDRILKVIVYITDID